LNEQEVIRRISALLPPAPSEVVVPVGDDCAVVKIGESTWVAASDMLTQGHHFKEWAAPGTVGYKAVAVNASDVAAMGGTPRFVLSSGGAPDPETALRCFEGVAEACERFGVYPLGGDTTRADALTVDVAILGQLHTCATCATGAAWDATWIWISFPWVAIPESSPAPWATIPRSSRPPEARTTSS
jgi:thiamine-monophosphate kinase